MIKKKHKLGLSVKFYHPSISPSHFIFPNKALIFLLFSQIFKRFWFSIPHFYLIFFLHFKMTRETARYFIDNPVENKMKKWIHYKALLIWYPEEEKKKTQRLATLRTSEAFQPQRCSAVELWVFPSQKKGSDERGFTHQWQWPFILSFGKNHKRSQTTRRAYLFPGLQTQHESGQKKKKNEFHCPSSWSSCKTCMCLLFPEGWRTLGKAFC